MEKVQRRPRLCRRPGLSDGIGETRAGVERAARGVDDVPVTRQPVERAPRRRESRPGRGVEIVRQVVEGRADGDRRAGCERVVGPERGGDAQRGAERSDMRRQRGLPAVPATAGEAQQPVTGGLAERIGHDLNGRIQFGARKLFGADEIAGQNGGLAGCRNHYGNQLWMLGRNATYLSCFLK